VKRTTRNPEVRRLSAVAVAVLESLHQHRLLSTPQIHALHMPTATPRWSQTVLCDLRDRGLAASARGDRGTGLWYLTPLGTETIQAAGTPAEPRRRTTTPAQASGPLRAHTLAVNDAAIAFVKSARERAGDECGPLSWRHEIAHACAAGRRRHGSHLLIADALLSYVQLSADDTLILRQRFVELDRGTVPTERLAAKLARYAQLRDYRASAEPADAPQWRTYYREFPQVLVVLADQSPQAARSRIQRTIALYRTDPGVARHGAIPTSLTSLSELSARGPFAPIFISIEHPERYQDWLGNVACEAIR
jgi:hypothetical protein